MTPEERALLVAIGRFLLLQSQEEQIGRQTYESRLYDSALALREAIGNVAAIQI